MLKVYYALRMYKKRQILFGVIGLITRDICLLLYTVYLYSMYSTSSRLEKERHQVNILISMQESVINSSCVGDSSLQHSAYRVSLLWFYEAPPGTTVQYEAI